MARSLAVILVIVAVAAGVGWGVGGPPIVGLAALCIGVQWLAFVPAWLGRTERFYDLTGSLTYLSVVSAALVVAPSRSPASWLAATLVALWAVRLGGFLALRIHRAGKDGRFDEIKQSFPRFLVAWSLQGLWVFLTSLAAVTLIVIAPPFTPWMAAGGLLWVLGFVLEVVADQQKTTFKAEATNEGLWIDTGLWGWSRHPNYAGEILLWTGVFVAGLGTWSGGQWLTALSPVFVTFLLTRVSGIPLLERRADARWGDDPAYQAYKARTPVLWPRPRLGS
jgi:steroid 5-alpha reductase family enzyme